MPKEQRKITTTKEYINAKGLTCYEGVDPSTPFTELTFSLCPAYETDIQYALHTNLGSLTVLDRMTGFGWRDIETGYRDKEGKFWLASGNLDVRESGAKTIQEAIDWVKKNAHNCKGD